MIEVRGDHLGAGGIRSETESLAPPRPSNAWRYKDTVFLVLGGILLAGGAFGVAVYSLYLSGPGAIIAGNVLCLGTGVIPGIVLLVYGWKARKEEKLLIQFSAWVKTYRRIPLNDLAKNMGKTRFETEGILARAVDRGLVQGIVDRTTDEFVVQSSIGQQVFVERCPHCSAAINRWFLPEDRLVCSYCGQPILAASAATNPRRPP